MKKILALILATVTLLGTMVMLTSCGDPKVDVNMKMSKIEEALEEEDYTVSTSKTSAPGVKQSLYAYNEDGDRLNIIWYEDVDLAKLTLEEYKLEAEYEKKEAKLEIKALKKYLDLYEDELDDDELEDMEEELEEAEEALEEGDYCYGRKGNVVWYGTADAIEASRG